MQWFAYVIWSALILCVLSAVVCYVMARRRAHLPQAPAPGCSGGHLQETPSTELDSARCQQLVERCGFDSAMLDAMTPDQQMTLGVDVLGADPAWLQGKDSAMYPCLTFHNHVAAAVEFIDTRLQEHPELRLYAVKPEGVPLDESVYEASVVLCFAQPVQVNDQQGWRYFPVNVYWEWGYPPSRCSVDKFSIWPVAPVAKWSELRAIWMTFTNYLKGLPYHHVLMLRLPVSGRQLTMRCPVRTSWG